MYNNKITTFKSLLEGRCSEYNLKFGCSYKKLKLEISRKRSSNWTIMEKSDLWTPARGFVI